MAAAQQSGNRGVELWTTDLSGQIWTLYQTTPGGAWSGWEGPGFKGQPVPAWQVAAADQNTGDLMLFTLDMEGSVWCIPQQSAGGNWGAWSGPSLNGQPCPFFQIAASQQNGNRGVELWGIDAEGQIWTLYQTTPGGAWSHWEGPGFKGQSVPMTRVAAAGQNTGSVMLFALDTNGSVWSIGQVSPGGNWGAWSGPNLADQPKPFHQISAAQQSGNRGVELWATDESGEIWTLYQTTPGGAWSKWEGPGFKGQTVPISRTAAAGQNNGDVELFALEFGGLALWSIAQSSAGGNWGAWIELPTPPAEQMSGWSEVGTGFTGILSGGDLLFALDAANSLSVFSATPGTWTPMGGPTASQYVGTSDAIYAITSDEATVMCLDAETFAWSAIGTTATFGNQMVQLIPALNALHGVDAKGTVWMYSGTPNVWTAIGGPFQAVTANDNYCFAITEDGQSVVMRPSDTGDWSTIGGPLASILAAGSCLYGTNASGAVFSYSGTPLQWTQIGDGFAQLSVSGIGLFGLTADKGSVQEYHPDLNIWMPIAGAADTIAAGQGFVAGLQSGTVNVRLLGPAGTAQQAAVADLADVQTEARVLTAEPLPVNSYNWMITIVVSSDVKDYYNGVIKVHVPNDKTGRALDVTVWAPGSTYTFPEKFSTDEITEMTLIGSSQLNTNLKVESVTAWNIETGYEYHFTVNQDIPNQSQSSNVHGLVIYSDSQTVSMPPAGATKIFVWPSRWLNLYTGHASMMLSDGTYIGWWPGDSVISAFMPYPLVATHPDPEDITYEKDVSNQGYAPHLILGVAKVDEAAVKAWWTSYLANADNLYRAGINNCCTIIYQALSQGGAVSQLSSRLQDSYDTVVPWTPAIVTYLVHDIAAAQSQS